MELRKYLFIIFFVLVHYYSIGQSLSIEPSINNLSNGIGLLYNQPLGKGWQASVGPRYLVNTFSINDNLRGNWYYQNGFAFTTSQHIGGIARVSKKVFSKGMFNVDAFSNLLITYTGLKRKYYNDRYGTILPGEPIVDIFKIDPGWSYEITIGPKITYTASDRWKIYTTVGFGIIFYSYGNEGVSLITNTKVIGHSSARWKHDWDYEMAGFEFLPILSLGCTFKLKR